MKKFFSVALAAVFAISTVVEAQAQKPFFLDKVGAEAEYAIKNPNGVVTSYTKSVVTDISYTDSLNFIVTYTYERFDGNRNPEAAPGTYACTIKEGATYYERVSEGPGLGTVGTLPSYPARLSKGMVMAYSYSYAVMGVKMDGTNSGRDTVVGMESVTTPAGTFYCYKINHETSSKDMLQTVTSKSASWIVEGVGTVKSESYDRRGRLLGSTELVSLK